ncbi:TetR/AcrR family transcriptional regulator [Phenylobacterium immobile]|uniref:TetR/AcrR family transcriptional regulator n=1 Tax=Phenylobacterium immobile TaxID=21 RepID=UPI000A7BBE77|nr:TetR/AcrR family transcriptional regulator [Phenylobacterium immobile]
MNKREQMALARRQAVLEAAIEAFIAKGFAAARIEDVAARAGVAKGTVYLGFRDKAELFAEAIRAEMGPLAQTIGAMIDDAQIPPRTAVESVMLAMARQAMTTRKGDVVRLILAETIRFPELTQFYRDEVVVPTAAKLVALMRRAADRGELRVAETAQFPQLLIAPVLLSALARDLLPTTASVDLPAMIKAHLDTVFV